MTTTTNLIELRKLVDAVGDTRIMGVHGQATAQDVADAYAELMAALEAQALDLDIQAGSIEAVQSANSRLSAQIEAQTKQIDALQAEVLELRSQLDSID